jgi:cytochrome c oxidase subunit 2
MNGNKMWLGMVLVMVLLGCSKSPEPIANQEPERVVTTPRAAPPVTAPSASAGKTIFERKGCPQCHSVDGAPSAGPTLKGRFGQPVQLHDGTSVTFDEAYARESLLEPLAKVPHGFVGNMPSYRPLLRDADVEHLVAYMKTL